MTVLTVRSEWRAPTAANEKRRRQPLTLVEQAHARRALRALRVMRGTSEDVADALGVSRTTVAQSAGKAA